MKTEGAPATSGKGRQGFWNSISTRFALSFGLTFVVILAIIKTIGLTGIPFTDYSGRYGDRKAEALRSLELIADLKKERLLRWLEERRDNIRVSARSENVRRNSAGLHADLRRWIAEGTSEKEIIRQLIDSAEYGDLREFLIEVKRIHEVYDSIYLIDHDTGKILVSTNEAHTGIDLSPEVDIRASGLTDFAVGDMVLDAQNQHPHFHFRHSIRDDAGKIITDLVMEVDPEDFLRPILRAGEGLGRKGEALLVNREGRILTSLKHPLADGSIAEPLKYGITAKPAWFASHWREGIIEDRDYRGEPVLAAYRHIRVTPEWGWGLVVKRDRAELYAPLRRDIFYSALLGLIGTIASAGLAIVLARGMTRPIRRLSRTAEEIAAGDLSARSPVLTTDEVGRLANTFNSMLDRLQNWHGELEGQVASRTTELVGRNEQLQREMERRIQSEEDLKESEAKYHDLFDNAPDMFCSVDAKTSKLLNCNLTLARALGFSRESLVGRPVFELYHPDSMEGAKEAFHSFVTTGIVRDAELQLRRKDGSRIEVSLNVSAIRDDEGNVTESRSVWRDITRSKQAEKALRKSELGRRLILEAAGQGIYGLDLDGNSTFVNPEAARMLGWTPEELRGRPQHDLIHY